jgi:polysaccharide biosynthesis protein PslF
MCAASKEIRPIVPQRVLLVTGEFPPMQGGVGDYTFELARTLSKLGHTVSVVTSVKGTTTEPGITVFPVMKTWSWQSWGQIIAIAQQTQSNIIHIQYQTAAFAMHPALNLFPLRLRLNRTRPRSVVTFHDLRVPYLFPKAGPLRRWVTIGMARWCDAAVITNIEDAIELGKQRVPFRLIPIGSNITTDLPPGYDRAAWRARLGIAPDETLLCYFGFLNESKGGETLIRALWELVSGNRDARLLMVGGQTGDSDPTNIAYLARIKKLIEDLRLTPYVIWTGFTTAREVSAHLLASDIAVLPYRDGASYRRGSFMAALSHGLPIVTTKGPGTAAIAHLADFTPDADIPGLVDGDNVLLVPPDDPTSIARAVIRLMSTPQLRQRLSTRAGFLAHVFSWEGIARRTSKVYEQIGK